MHNLPIRTLILCVLLPPFAYVFSIHFLEKHFQARYDRELASITIGDTRALFDGSVRLQDAVHRNVEAFLASRTLIDRGLRATVTVKTADGAYLYPAEPSPAPAGFEGEDRIAIARENFRMLNDGLIRTVDVDIEHNTWIANLVLAAWLGISLAVLGLVYRHGVRISREAEHANRAVIDTLASEKQASLDRLAQLEAQRSHLAGETQALQEKLARQRRQATDAEAQMFDELVALEDQIDGHRQRQEEQLREIEELKATIAQSAKANEVRRHQLAKAADGVKKRFNTLYKQIRIHDRAVDGYLDLTEELKIKAEEVIHQMNADFQKVPIKRKVFGKKNRETVFEVVFAYKGRLYFRNLPDRRSEVLAIGTKLTQAGDLSFLNKR